jgi:tRNA (mo5U34)-methyltransferase
MKNVWFIPAPSLVERWLARAGFTDIRLLDMAPTGVEEQRATRWMDGASLADALDPDHPGRTIEGEPAPVRAIWSARKG